MHPDERTARQQLAACYRIFAQLGWVEMIYNHITLRLPDSVTRGEKHFLINPFGLHYNEVTASNLVKVNLAGEVLDGSRYPINPAGYVLHSTIHAGVQGAHCVMHTHTTAGVAVASLASGLSQSNFYSAQLHGMVAYHDFEGITIHAEEGPRVLASINGTLPPRAPAAHGALPPGGGPFALGRPGAEESRDPAQPRLAELGRNPAAGLCRAVDAAARVRDPIGHAKHGRSAAGARGRCRWLHARFAAV